MKRKIFSVLFALVLVCSLSLVMAAPVAADVDTVTVDVDPELISTVAEYTIGFNTGVEGGLSANVGTITVTFPEGTTVPDTTPYATGAITVNSTAVLDEHVSVTGLAVTINTPVGISASKPVVVIFTTAAGIKNPATPDTTYKLTVYTSVEPTVVQSAVYTIIGLPTVTGVHPNSGNVDDVMWVEVKGTNFIKDDTSFSFGDGVSVVDGSYHWIDAEEIDCQITITAFGTARDVVATTGAGDSVVNAGTDDDFTPNDADTPQVDVWDTYSPVEDLLTADAWDDATLEMTAAVQTTIEAAVGNSVVAGVATESDVVRVHEATYNLEDVRYPIFITDANLKLVAFGEPKIVPGRPGSGMQEGVISIRADSVTIDGFIIVNEAFINGDWGISAKSSRGGTNPTIKNNTISGFGSNDPAAVYANCVAIQVMGVTGTIEDNIVQDNRTGIELSGSNNTTIRGNLVQNNRNGIALFGSTGVIVTQNKVYTSSSSGIYVNLGSTGGTFELNDIVGNTTGFTHDTGASIDARYNYWGKIGGPSAGTGNSPALGNGDAVSADDVIYNPWLSVSYVTVVADGKRYYGSDSLTLQAGWNTLSVPLELYDLADTITEIEAMGDFLTAANYVGLIYEYDSVGGFVTPTTPLTPCRGYYIKMKAASNFPVLYSNSLGLPALPLTAGWNLIGSAFGIDKLVTSTWAVGVSETGTHTGGDDEGTVMTDSSAAFIEDELIGLTIVNETDGSSGVITDNDGTSVTVAALTGGTDNDWDTGDVYSIRDAEAVMAIKFALDSIGDQVSVVISPSVPGQIGDPWAEIWADDAANFMYTGEAYWVFMTDTGTLCGWEITPFYFIP